MELTLYFAPATCSRVPLTALEEVGVPFRTELVAMAEGVNRAPPYLRMNPAGKLPLLLADGRPIPQNTAILLFLAQRFPAAGLLPLGGDAVADAQVLARLAWFAADLHPLVTRIRFPVYACDSAPLRVREQASASMRNQLLPLQAQLAQQPWVLGDRWSILDIYLQWVWFRITGAGFDATDFPALVDHHTRVAARPALQRALAREAEGEQALRAQGAWLGIAPDGLRPQRDSR